MSFFSPIYDRIPPSQMMKTSTRGKWIVGLKDSLSWEETRNWPAKMQGFGLMDEDEAKHATI